MRFCVKNKLDAILQIVVPILKKDYLISIVEDINKCLQDNIPKHDYANFMKQINVMGCEKKKCFYFLFKPEYQVLREDMIEKLRNYPVLRSRILLFSDIKSTKDLRDFIDRYVQRITWHLYRMYRTRNAIIHSGEVPHNLKYLGEHLHAYVDSTVNEFIVKLSGTIPFDSIEDVIVDVKFAVDNIDATIAKNENISDKIINLLIHPEIGHIMHCEQHDETMDNDI